MTDRELLRAYLVAVAAFRWACALHEEESIVACGREVVELGGRLRSLGYDIEDITDLQRRLA